jgi:hypothetical protein
MQNFVHQILQIELKVYLLTMKAKCATKVAAITRQYHALKAHLHH